MTIDKLGPINQIASINKTGKAGAVHSERLSDSVQISNDARTMGELYQLAEKVKACPDVRADKVAEMREKLKDPNYINQKMVEAVADKLVGLYNL